MLPRSSHVSKNCSSSKKGAGINFSNHLILPSDMGCKQHDKIGVGKEDVGNQGEF